MGTRPPQFRLHTVPAANCFNIATLEIIKGINKKVKKMMCEDEKRTLEILTAAIILFIAPIIYSVDTFLMEKEKVYLFHM